MVIMTFLKTVLRHRRLRHGLIQSLRSTFLDIKKKKKKPNVKLLNGDTCQFTKGHANTLLTLIKTVVLFI